MSHCKVITANDSLHQNTVTSTSQYQPPSVSSTFLKGSIHQEPVPSTIQTSSIHPDPVVLTNQTTSICQNPVPPTSQTSFISQYSVVPVSKTSSIHKDSVLPPISQTSSIHQEKLAAFQSKKGMCPYCSETYAHSSSLSRHIKKVHRQLREIESICCNTCHGRYV